MSAPTAWIKRSMEQERLKRGNACQNTGCDSPDARLHFAHVKRTPCTAHGREHAKRGRGRVERLQDIRRNPDAYILLCYTCHRRFDNGQLPEIIIRLEPCPGVGVMPHTGGPGASGHPSRDRPALLAVAS
jgi:hypothetical protein